MSTNRQLSARRITSAVAVLFMVWPLLASAGDSSIVVRSPDGRNSLTLDPVGKNSHNTQLTVARDNRHLIRATSIGPRLTNIRPLGEDSQVSDARPGSIDEPFSLPWGKTKRVSNRCSTSVVTLASAAGVRWQIELRAYDDGVAFRYRLLEQAGTNELAIRDETTRFEPLSNPTALFNTLDSFTTSHESLYDRQPVSELPAKRLIEMPILFVWQGGAAAALTEARVRHFAGGYLERPSNDHVALAWKLSPHPSHPGISVLDKPPVESPWRVILLGDSGGKLLESNLLLCLNDPPRGDFSWAHPGKTTFHWWYGEFEDDFKDPHEADVYLARHKRYIDFCAANKIAYHSVSGDGYAWYMQSRTDYGTPKPDADVRRPRPELKLPEIIRYARERGVGIRLWVHWKPLSEHLDEAFALYESWGVQGLMVDFLDRDDQEMIDFTERLLQCAARHKLHIQIHGSSKYSGEQRTYPNLFNREGVLNLEYDKWSTLCTPQHAVNVAFTRALTGPVDFHLGGFRSISRTEFRPRDRAPEVLGTRAHHLALYVVYENPMPMVADAPQSYAGQPGFDFIRDVPTTWDETHFVAGAPGEFIVLARRHGRTWYLAGITNGTKRELNLPLDVIGSAFRGTLYADGSLNESEPNALKISDVEVSKSRPLRIPLAPGGGFVAVLKTF